MYFQQRNGSLVFLKKGFHFEKICFKVKVLETFKISSDCHLTLNVPILDKVKKIKLNMKAFKAFIKPFETPQRSVKIKI